MKHASLGAGETLHQWVIRAIKIRLGQDVVYDPFQLQKFVFHLEAGNGKTYREKNE